MHASREKVHNEAFNVGRTEENYRIRQVSDLVKEIVPGSEVTYAAVASPDTRNYRVNYDQIRRILPEFKPTWTVRQGIEELYEAYRANEITEKKLEATK